MLTFLGTYSKEIVSLLVPLLSLWLGQVFRARVKLLWSIRHSSTMLIVNENKDDPNRIAHAINFASLFFQNTGREPASSLEVVFNWKPQYFNIWPQREYEESINPDGRFIVKFPTLAPKEFFGIDLMAFQTLPDMVTFRSKQATGSHQEMLPQPVHPKWKLFIVAYLMLAGFAASIYWVITALQFLG